MKDMSKRILLARCQNCEEQIQRQGKSCAWRSLGNDYCWEASGGNIESYYSRE